MTQILEGIPGIGIPQLQERRLLQFTYYFNQLKDSLLLDNTQAIEASTAIVDALKFNYAEIEARCRKEQRLHELVYVI